MYGGSPTVGTWSSSPWRPDNEFETDRMLDVFDDEDIDPPLGRLQLEPELVLDGVEK
jgi:hypothetical protein